MAKRYKITECNVDDVIGSLKDYVASLSDNEMRRREIVSTISGIAQSLQTDSERTIPGVPGVQPEPDQSLMAMSDEVPQIEFNDDGELQTVPNELELLHDPSNPEGIEDVDIEDDDSPFKRGEKDDEEESEFDEVVDKEIAECEGGGAMSAQGAQGGSDAEGGGVNHPENPKNTTAILFSDPRKKKKKTKFIKRPALETEKDKK